MLKSHAYFVAADEAIPTPSIVVLLLLAICVCMCQYHGWCESVPVKPLVSSVSFLDTYCMCTP